MTDRSRYLLGLYVAEHRESAPVSPGVVGEMVDRSPATVIEAFRRFEEEGLAAFLDGREPGFEAVRPVLDERGAIAQPGC